MRIACPACATAYEVPEDRLAPGQVVRCARCGTDWTPRMPEPREQPMLEAAPQAEPEPLEPELAPLALAVEAPAIAAEERDAPTAPKPRNVALRLAWALSVVVLLGAVWAAYAARDGVMHAWPPSVRAYATLGLAPRH